MTLNGDEKEVYDFVKSFGDLFISISEVSRRLGTRGRYQEDRLWAKPLLLRLEVEGILESNPYGEFRSKDREHGTDFITAMEKPNPEIDLGDTTIIMLSEVRDNDSELERPLQFGCGAALTG